MIDGFLNQYRHGGPWVLTAIAPDGPTETRTFTTATDAEAWALKQNETKNVYFHVNRTRGPLVAKAKKSDIAAVEFLHVDIDPRTGEEFTEERARIRRLLTEELPKDVPPPSLVIDSGGGYQAFWRLSEPLPLDGSTDKAAEAERYNRALELAFKADHCHNVDRIMRLPGTTNWPTKKKRAKGREKAEAKVLCWNGVTYSLDAFSPSPPLHQRSSTRPSGESSFPVGVDQLRAWADANGKTIEEHTLALITTGTHPIDPHHYPSRSEALFRVTCDLVRAGVPDELIFGAITDPNNAISASVREQRNWRAYAQRQIEHAGAECSDPLLQEMNKKHAVLLQEGGKTRVLSWERTELDEERLVPVLQSFQDFRNRYMHRFVEFRTDKGVGRKPLGQWWLEHAQRREYLALRFFPGQSEEVDGFLNMWRGWAVSPKAGDWSLMREHINRVLASGNGACADYILRWAAWAIQNPGEPAEVALVLRGGKGTGKGVFARTLRRLFGQHGLHVNSPGQLTGRFNAHLRDCCLLFADEAIVPGDKAGESVLKALITEPELTIEGKGVNLVQARNRLHVVMASNEAWVVPATIDERRFAVFEVSSDHARDNDYFRALFSQIDNGGRAAMLHDLLAMDLGGWHPRQGIPQTDALHVQKAATVRGFEAVFLDLLRAGEIPIRRWSGSNQPFVSTAELREYAQRHLRREDVSLNAVNKLMRDLGFEYHDKSRPRGFVLPPLQEARTAWDRARMPMRWDEATEWSELYADESLLAMGKKGPF